MNKSFRCPSRIFVLIIQRCHLRRCSRVTAAEYANLLRVSRISNMNLDLRLDKYVLPSLLGIISISKMSPTSRSCRRSSKASYKHCENNSDQLWKSSPSIVLAGKLDSRTDATKLRWPSHLSVTNLRISDRITSLDSGLEKTRATRGCQSAPHIGGKSDCPSTPLFTASFNARFLLLAS